MIRVGRVLPFIQIGSKEPMILSWYGFFDWNKPFQSFNFNTTVRFSTFFSLGEIWSPCTAGGHPQGSRPQQVQWMETFYSEHLGLLYRVRTGCKAFDLVFYWNLRLDIWYWNSVHIFPTLNSQRCKLRCKINKTGHAKQFLSIEVVFDMKLNFSFHRPAVVPQPMHATLNAVGFRFPVGMYERTWNYHISLVLQVYSWGYLGRIELFERINSNRYLEISTLRFRFNFRSSMDTFTFLDFSWDKEI